MKPPRTIDILPSRNDARSVPTHQERAMIGHIEQLNKVLSNISFGDTSDNLSPAQNIEGWYAAVTSSGVADTEFAVPHQLGRVPIGFLVFSKSNAGVVYKGATAWTSSNIYLKDSGISDVLLLFIV